MFLYPYPHPAHFTEGGSTWNPENRLGFPPNGEMGNNGRTPPIGNKGSNLLELGNGNNGHPHVPGGPVPEHGVSIKEESLNNSCVPTSSSIQFHTAPDQTITERKPTIGHFSDASIASYNFREKCRTCGEEVLQADLIQHMRNHMGPRRCEICNYEAPTKHHLREHLNTHTGLKPYKCQYCEKCFAAKNSLRVHTMYLHTKIRAHQCHFCDQRFVTTSERKSHELVHTDKCPVCQMSFRLRGHLRQHMKSHANAAFHQKKKFNGRSPPVGTNTQDNSRTQGRVLLETRVLNNLETSGATPFQ